MRLECKHDHSPPSSISLFYHMSWQSVQINKETTLFSYLFYQININSTRWLFLQHVNSLKWSTVRPRQKIHSVIGSTVLQEHWPSLWQKPIFSSYISHYVTFFWCQVVSPMPIPYMGGRKGCFCLVPVLLTCLHWWCEQKLTHLLAGGEYDKENFSTY
jgi:hypothetical protein